ncbi:hypothetical protein AB0N71_02175 [Pseudarthrobacter enclensis]|uniref:hypothetical protein n=1 Tax=Pseudarthrobacter enclensis TaxID=993070 RepID=UPI00343DD577
MRRNNLLALGMLSILLATSACGTGSSDVSSSNPAVSGVGASDTAGEGSSASVGATQRTAAKKAEAAAEEKAKAEARKTEAKAAERAAAEAAALKEAEAAAKAASAVPQVAPERVAEVAPVPAAAPSKQTPPAAAVQPASGAERVVNTTYTTAYTWHDNTPAGSATISHPVLHKTAGGTGTFEDPLTIAVGHSLATGEDVLDVPAGTRIYIPSVRRYFIVEDTCGDGNDPENGPCHQGTNANGTNSTIWIDMWIGGQSMSADGADSCASEVTGVKTAVFNPASNYAVAPGAGVIHDGKCDAGYGDALVRR